MPADKHPGSATGPVPEPGSRTQPAQPVTLVRESTDWRRVGVLFVTGSSCAFHIGKIPSGLPVLAEDLGLSLFQSSWIVALFSLLIAVLGVVVGLWAARGRYRLAALTGLLLAGLASLLGSLATSVEVLLLTRILEGLGWILVAVSTPVLMVSISTPEDRPLVLGIWGAFQPFGMVIMLLLSPSVLALSSWQGLWQLTGLLTLASFLLMYLATRSGFGSPVHTLTLQTAVRVIARTAPLMMFICFLTYSAEFSSVMAFFPTLLLDTTAVGISAAAFLTALAVSANIIGNVGAGWFLRRGVGRRAILFVGMVGMGLSGIVIFSDVMPLALRILAVIGFSCLGGLVPATMFATAPLIVQSAAHVGIVNGFIMQAAGTGQLLGPPLLSGVVDWRGSWQAATAFTLLVSGFGLIGAQVLHRKLDTAATSESR